MWFRLLLSAVVLSIAFGDMALAADSPPLMTVPGQFNVSGTGAATYSVPIAVPPGTAGMAPSISLNYSSQNGDGIVGLGWSLSYGGPAQGRERNQQPRDNGRVPGDSTASVGVTQHQGGDTSFARSGTSGALSGGGGIGARMIVRCARTLAQDGVHGNVAYDANDRFCMDGQRLVAISGTYGANGTEYRTEIESFIKVISIGQTGSGPSAFEVHTRQGTVLYYGSAANSRVVPTGMTSIRAWALDKVADTKGNYLTVTYTNDAANGQIYPSRIDYTGNSGASLTPYNSVQFFYTTRADIVPTYQAGYVLQNTVLLTDIKTFVGTTQVLDYKLAYSAASSGATHNELTSLRLYDAGGNQLAATTFGWQGSRDTLTPTALPLPTGLPAFSGFALFESDYNGDGIADFMLPSTDQTGCPIGIPFSYGRLQTYQGAANGTFTLVVPQLTTYNDSNGTSSTGPFCVLTATSMSQIGDFDGDGREDIALSSLLGNGWSFYFNTGGNYTFHTRDVYGIPRGVALGDLNGDGFTDGFMPSDITNSTTVDYISNGSGLFTAGTAHGMTTGDFDGDGCTDGLFQSSANSYRVDVFLSCGSALWYQTAGPWTAASQYAWNYVLGDFNGDGLTDVLFDAQRPSDHARPNSQLWLSTGVGWNKITLPLALAFFDVDYFSSSAAVGDFNGDGKSDVVIGSNIWLATGTGFVAVAIGSIMGKPGDFNRDGAADLFGTDQTTFLPVLTGFGYVPELLTTIGNGLGATTTITYDRINKNGALYAKGSGASYPTNDVDDAMYVVARVDASNGIGGTAGTTYAYGGAKKDLQGRGFLGFSTVAASDLETGIVTTTSYQTAFPYTGMPAAETSVTTLTRNGCTSGVTLNAVANTFAATNLGGTRNFVYLQQSVVSGHDCDGTALPTTTTGYTYDSYGNATQRSVSVSDGSSNVTTNTFTNDTTNWILGQLDTAQVRGIVGASDITRKSCFQHQAGSGLVTREVIEPAIGSCTYSSVGVQTDYTLDAFGNRTGVSISGPNFTTRASGVTYDAKGRFVAAATNALGQSESFTVDPAFGTPLTHTDLNGLVTSWSHDGFGRPTLETRPDGTRTVFAYAYCGGGVGCPTFGAFRQQATPQASGGTQNGPQASVYFDSLSRVIAKDTQGFNAATIREATQYDADGRVAQASRPYFVSGGTARWTSFVYDDLGRPVQTTYPDTSQSTAAYHGLSASTTNALGQTTTVAKNAQGLNASVTDALGHATAYVYDAFGDLLTVTDPSGNVTGNTYDIRGNRTATADPDMGAWGYTYNGLGQLLTQTDAKSQVTTLTYDLLGRMTQRAEPGLTSTWTWDSATHGVGQLAAAATSGGYGRVLTYDTLSRPASTTLTIGGGTYVYATTYDTTTGQVATVAYPSGFTAHRLYTSLGYLSQVQDNATAAVLFTVTARDAEQHLTGSTAGNGVATTRTFDPDTGLPTGLRAGASGAVASFDYAFDSIGNLVSRADNDTSYTERFCYDGLNRLTSYKLSTSTACPLGGTGAKTVAYDALGNITAKSDVGSYAYPSSGGSSVRPHAVAAIAGTVNGIVDPNYHYDANGNLDCVHTGSYPAACGGGGAVRKIVSTAFNMAGTVTEGTTTVAFAYDGEHQRIVQASTVAGVTTTTHYLNDPASGTMAERVTVGAAPGWTDYLTVDGQIVAQYSTAAGPAAPLWGGAITWGAGSASPFTWTATAAPRDGVELVHARLAGLRRRHHRPGRDRHPAPQLRRLGPPPQRERHRPHRLHRRLTHHARLHQPGTDRRAVRGEPQRPHLRSHHRAVHERGHHHHRRDEPARLESILLRRQPAAQLH